MKNDKNTFYFFQNLPKKEKENSKTTNHKTSLLSNQLERKTRILYCIENDIIILETL